MAYIAFTKEKVFKSHNINVICNQIYEALINEFDVSTIETKFCITGTVAKIIQGDPLSEIEVIPFITNEKAIMDFCRKGLTNTVGGRAVALSDRVQMVYKGIHFEFHETSSIGTINTVTGLQVQDPADIPGNIS